MEYAVDHVAGDDVEADRVEGTNRGCGKAGEVPTLAEIAENLPPVTWLWPGWSAAGDAPLLGAYQGTGKVISCWTLARSDPRRVWPDGAEVEARKGRSICMGAGRRFPQVTNGAGDEGWASTVSCI